MRGYDGPCVRNVNDAQAGSPRPRRPGWVVIGWRQDRSTAVLISDSIQSAVPTPVGRARSFRGHHSTYGGGGRMWVYLLLGIVVYVILRAVEISRGED